MYVRAWTESIIVATYVCSCLDRISPRVFIDGYYRGITLQSCIAETFLWLSSLCTHAASLSL